jgi:hypothetical protein
VHGKFATLTVVVHAGDESIAHLSSFLLNVVRFGYVEGLQRGTGQQPQPTLGTTSGGNGSMSGSAFRNAASADFQRQYDCSIAHRAASRRRGADARFHCSCTMPTTAQSALSWPRLCWPKRNRRDHQAPQGPPTKPAKWCFSVLGIAMIGYGLGTVASEGGGVVAQHLWENVLSFRFCEVRRASASARCLR